MVDSVARWAQGAITEAGETVGEAIIGGAGALFMPFVTPLEEFEPVQEYKEDKGTSVDPNKMTPQMMRKEKDLLNKQLREAAFMGVCHLPVQYAGKKKQIDDDTYRLNKRLEDLKKEFTKKYPPGSFVDLGKGRFRILPVYKGNGGAGVLSKLKVEMPQALKQMFLKTEPPPKTGDAPTGEERPLVVDAKPPKVIWENKPKKPAAKPGTPEYKEYERLVKRLNKIRIDAQDFKKRTDMENEIKEYRRRIKDLESRSTIPRNASKRTEDGKVLERGELIRLANEDEEVKKKYPDSPTVGQKLIEAGAEINGTNEDGFTPLMLAARNGHTKSVEFLLQCADIDPYQTNNFGCTAMHYAAMYGHLEVVELLNKVPPNAADMKLKKIENNMKLRPRHCADREVEEYQRKKKEIWDQTYKEKKFLLVQELDPKNKDNCIKVPVPDALGGGSIYIPTSIYEIVGKVEEPSKVAVPKEWKPDTWRISKIPDPACKVDPISERELMNRWKLTGKKCGPAK